MIIFVADNRYDRRVNSCRNDGSCSDGYRGDNCCSWWMTVTVLLRRTLCRLSQPFLCWGPSELRGQGVGDHVKSLFLSCEFYVARSRDGAAFPITWLESFPLAPKKASAILMKILKEAAFQTKHLHQRRTWPTPWNHSLKGQRGTGYSVISSRWAKGNRDAIPLSQIRILWRGVISDAHLMTKCLYCKTSRGWQNSKIPCTFLSS